MIIDADTHIIESDAMWDLLDPGLRRRRPLVVSVPDDTVFGTQNAFWVVDGHLHPNPVGRGAYRLHTPSAAKFELARTDTTREAREITDVAARLADMDRLNVDVQVIYPTFFLHPVTDDPSLQVGLARAYNQYCANAWRESGGRLRWIVVPPLASPDDAVAEISWGKEHGAVGVFMHGFENEGSAGSRAYFPLYAKALECNLPICIHTGVGATDLARNWGGFGQTAVIHAFRDIVLDNVPKEFPGLRFGFIECGASWVPFVFQIAGRAHKAPTRLHSVYASEKLPDPADVMRDYNLYVACFADEDLTNLLHTIAPERIVTGSDYGHADPSFEANMVDSMRARTDLQEKLVEQIMSENAAALYNIGESDAAAAGQS